MAAGYRPCLRCRPEVAPGSPAWGGVSTTVKRALRLINEGALDQGNLQELAERLGVGERHLRRLFLEHVGASPKAVAQTRRLLFAKKLITETRLSLTTIAMNSGFQSLRRFNDAFLKLYGRPPRALRKEIDESAAVEKENTETPITLKLGFRPPFDWGAMLNFFSTRVISGVEAVDNGTYRRTIRVGKECGILQAQVDPAHNHLAASISMQGTDSLQLVVEKTRRLFDLDADPAPIIEHLGCDPLLRKILTRRPGLRVPGAWDAFELSVRAVLGQQVSVAAAATFARRLVETCGSSFNLESDPALSYVFPTPEDVLSADLSDIGLTTRRQETLRTLAKAFADGNFDNAAAWDSETNFQKLCDLPGIGPWSAQYIAMRAFNDQDAFPEGDLGLLNAMAALGEHVDKKGLSLRAESWRPWRAYATMHLWMRETP